MKKKLKHLFGRFFGSRDDGSRKIRPESPKDFSGIERAQKSRRNTRGNEWEFREEEKPTP